MHTFVAITQLGKMLRQIEHWLDLSAKYAETRPFDVEVLAHARLAPDQFPLIRQIQSACDAAKYAAAYLSGTEAPSHPDTEKTLAEGRERIAKCLAYLETFSEKDFDGAETRKVSPVWMRGGSLTGEQYLVQVAQPNFYFHVGHAYAILRHSGVPMGKGDFMGPMPR